MMHHFLGVGVQGATHMHEHAAQWGAHAHAGFPKASKAWPHMHAHAAKLDVHARAGLQHLRKQNRTCMHSPQSQKHLLMRA